MIRKKFRYVIVFLGILFFLSKGLFFTRQYEMDSNKPRKIFENYSRDAVSKVVACNFLNEEFVLSEEEMDIYTKILQEQVVYTYYADEPIMAITTPSVVMEYQDQEHRIYFANNLIIDNGVAYNCEYESCKKMSDFLKNIMYPNGRFEPKG